MFQLSLAPEGKLNTLDCGWKIDVDDDDDDDDDDDVVAGWMQWNNL